jgi:Overcoming lysogenization defect protein-like, TOPRIM domain
LTRGDVDPPTGGVSALRAVVLVEGNSDRVALRTLAERQGRDLDAVGVEVVAMGGITNTRAVATRYGPAGLDLPLAGLYDVGEVAVLRRGLAAAGLTIAADPDGLRRLGFHACSADLEDELIRALGVEGVEEVVAAAGEARSLRLLTGMPAQRGWTREAVLRRFLGSQAGRKARYAALMVDALDPARVPAPLTAVLERVAPSACPPRGR